MKVLVKIVILVLAITLAIGGIMIYAKTRVEPPVATKAIDQFSRNLEDCYKSLAKENVALEEDSIFSATMSKINIFVSESKMEPKDGDSNIDRLLAIYTPLFLKRSFGKFNLSTWNESDHKYMLNVVSKLKGIKHSDNSKALQKRTTDSLALIEVIISRYNHARAVSRLTGFAGISNAKATISKAKEFANDSYLKNCHDLVIALNNVKPSIARSHYHYISNMVEKLTLYKKYDQYYYENSLVPQVDAAVTEYDNNASSLYGSKQSVEPLWSKARGYYETASKYYNKEL